MGGKSSTQTSQVTIPPEVLARYNAVNAQAQQTAATPFQQYSTDPDAFVAPINAQQSTGISGINTAANEAQPYFGAATSQLETAQGSADPYYGAAGTSFSGGYNSAQPYNEGATGLALAGAQQVNPTQLTGQDINQYLSPYLGDVLGSESAVLNQNNQQQQAGQLGNAITSGAFGGDRAGIAAANLEQQQNLSNANIYSGILNTGYNNALATAQQQQGVGLAAGQANRAAIQNAAGQIQSIGQQDYTQGMGLGTAQEGLGQTVYGTGAATSAAEANLGTGAQAAAEQGAQAQLAAGTQQQQTTQAGDTALYNQFLQQQSYPFQVDQFLANIAEGTGALSGSTTTTTQPGALFSDERLKEDIEPIGKTYDGQNIVAFRYKGDNKKQIGLIAQDVEKKHPEAVGLASGYKTVNYDTATREAADRGHFRVGGRTGFALGGYPGQYPLLPGMSQYDLAGLVEAQNQMYAPFSNAGLYGSPGGGAVRGGSSYVPAANLPVSHLAVANAPERTQQSPMQNAQQIAELASNKAVQNGLTGLGGAIQRLATPSGQFSAGAESAASDVTMGPDVADSLMGDMTGGMRRGGLARASGGLAGRGHFDDGGAIDPYDPTNDNQSRYGPKLDIPDDPSSATLATAKTGQTGQSPQSPLGQAGGLAKDVEGLGSLFGLGSTAAGMAGIGGGAALGAGATAAATAGMSALPDLLPLLLLSTGGRAGFAQGGDTSDPDMADQDLHSTLLNLIQGDPSDDSAPPPVSISATGVDPTVTQAGAGFAPPGVGLGRAPQPLAPAPAANTNAPPSAPQLTGNTDLQRTLALIGKSEGTGRNPMGSAQGLYQIIDPTFVGAFRQMFPQRAASMSNGQIIGLRSTSEGAQLSAQMGPYLAEQNISTLQKSGFEPSAPNVYLAHFLGPSTAIKFLKADPSTPVGDLVSPAVINSNASIMKGKTVGDVIGWTQSRLAQVAKRNNLATGGRAGFADGGDPDPDSTVDTGFAAGAPALPPAAQGMPSGQSQGLGGGMGDFAPVVGGQVSQEADPQKKGILQRLTQPEVFIPLLTGIAAAASAPTRNSFTALAVGAGAAGQAYQAQRQYGLQQQQLQQHGAEVGVEQAMVPIRQQEVTNQGLQIRANMVPLIQAQLAQQYQVLPGNLGPDHLPQYKDVRSGQVISASQYAQIYNERLNGITGVMDSGGQGAGLGSVITGVDNGQPVSGAGVGGVDASSGPPPPVGPGAVANGPTSGAAVTGGGPLNPAGPVGGAPQSRNGPAKPVGAKGSVVGHQGQIDPDAQLAGQVSSGAFSIKNTIPQPVAPSEDGLDPNNSPSGLMRLAESTTDPALAASYRKQALDMAQGVGAEPLNAQGQPDNRYTKWAADNTAYQAQVAAVGSKREQFSGAQSAVPANYQTQRQVLDSMSQSLQTTQPTAQADALHQAASLLFPMLPPGPMKSQIEQYATNVDVANKDAARLAIAQAIAGGMSTGTGGATLLDFSHAANPHVGQSPEAQWQLITQAYAMQDRALKESQDYNSSRGQIENTDAWNTAWQQAHPYQTFQQKAEQYTPFFAGSSTQFKGQHPKVLTAGQDPRALPSGTPFLDPRDGKTVRWVP